MSGDPLFLPPGHELPSLGEAMGMEDYHVGLDTTSYFEVSTIHLGRLLGRGRENSYETMVFGLGYVLGRPLQGRIQDLWQAVEHGEFQLRWGSREEARLAHEKIVETIRAVEATLEIE